jgi:hypothetical protein
MRFRKLRITWSVGCGIACLLLLVLWVRSYTRHDGIWGRFSETNGFHLSSHEGRIQFQQIPFLLYGMIPWQLALNQPIETSTHRKVFNRFEVLRGGFGLFIALPLWFLVLVTCLLATLSWLPIWRFRLRTFLIAVTLVALLLEWSVHVARN